MLKIAICDDERYFRDNVKDYVMTYMNQLKITGEIDMFSSGKRFIEMGIEIQKYDIIFLDINMKGLDGIQTAKKIRDVSKDIFIVFVTAYINYTLEGYKVDAIRYLLKDDMNFKYTIQECIDAIIEKMDYKVLKREFLFSEGKKTLILDNILYIESHLHKLEVHVMEKELKIYSLYEKLDSIEEQLKAYGFIRIHQSFLINIKYLKDVTNYKAILNNGVELVIPKVRYKTVKNMFIAYQGEL
jgi:Response regulator of the LytR/AlgR family